MYTELFKHISKFVSLSDQEQHAVIPYLDYAEVKKKEFLLQEGQKINAQYFVTRGCLRMYFIKENGSEQIIQFGIDNWWISDYMSLELHQPSRFFIQAIEHSKIVILTYDNQEKLLAGVPRLERYFRKVMQKAYAASQMRIKYLFDLSGEEQYHQFNNAYPEFVQRIPQYMLASYLGFTPEFLSKIRAKKH